MCYYELRHSMHILLSFPVNPNCQASDCVWVFVELSSTVVFRVISHGSRVYLWGIITCIVSEHDEELIQVHENYLIAAVCVCGETWVGAYGCYYVMSTHQDGVLGYDALACNDVYLYLTLLAGYVK